MRNYRLFAGGQIVSLTGTWAQRTAQDWLALQLSHNSGTAIGVVTGLQFLPVLLLSLYGGVIADRYDKRTVLVWTQVAQGVQALILGVLTVLHVVTLTEVAVLAVALGVASAVDTPVRQAFVTEIVGPGQLVNAVSLNSATFNAARIVGPAVAGVLIAGYGTGPVFLGNSASYLAVIAGLLAMRRGELFPAAPVRRARGQLRAGLHYVRCTPGLLWPTVLVGVVGTFGLNFQLTTALMAKLVFHRSASSYGVLGSCFAAGALVGALAAARRSGGAQEPRMRVLVGAAAVFGLLEVVCGLMPSYLTFAILLIPTGAAVLTFTTTANAVVQLNSDPQMRGRVMALYVLVFLGGTPLGAPLIGAVAQAVGARSGLVVGGAVSAAAAVAIAAVLRGVGRGEVASGAADADRAGLALGDGELVASAD